MSFTLGSNEGGGSRGQPLLSAASLVRIWAMALVEIKCHPFCAKIHSKMPKKLLTSTEASERYMYLICINFLVFVSALWCCMPAHLTGQVQYLSLGEAVSPVLGMVQCERHALYTAAQAVCKNAAPQTDLFLLCAVQAVRIELMDVLLNSACARVRTHTCANACPTSTARATHLLPIELKHTASSMMGGECRPEQGEERRKTAALC